ncbi:dual specificity protein phosphatase family protein [Ideonella sp. A 288]|uniref:dual specificity protein phosphatase family protein n=1 Tax=Ideonella sp. A 288 TaxID=1962181 RepID=UPI001185918F|nr:dual specificity protein phosphatase family protein [Ideonella sp. A 288]
MPAPRVIFVSQKQAERMRPPDTAVLVSITDHRTPEARMRVGWAAVLRVRFDDVDPVTFPGQNLDLTPMSLGQATEVAQFVSMLGSGCTRVVVHCKHGISRSAAVAKAVAAKMGAAFPKDYREYNKHVYALVSQALGVAQEV